MVRLRVYRALLRSSVGRGPSCRQGCKEKSAPERRCSLRQFHHATPKSENQYHYFFSAGLDGLDADSPGGQQFYGDILEAFLEDKLFIESQQSGVERDPSRRLLLREHDRAVAYRQAIHEMQADEVQREAAE